MKELTVKRKGILTEESLKLWFLQQGFSVSVPIGDDDRYDFIVDFDGKLIKMQSKTSNLTRTVDCLNFATASIKYNASEIGLYEDYIFVNTLSGVARISMKGKGESFLPSNNGRLLVYDSTTALVCGDSKADYLVFGK